MLSRFCQIKWEQARALRIEGKLTEAEQELLEALEEAPDDPLLKSSLANLYVAQGKLLEARVLVDEILREDPQCLQALVVRGELAFKERNFPQALLDFDQAWQMDPKPYLTLRRARTLKEMARYAEALDALDSFLVAHRENVALLKEKALILNRMARWDEALEVYEKLRDMGCHDNFVNKEMLRIKSESRSRDVVIKELQKTIGMSSRQNDAQLHGLLGQKLKESGQVQEAAAEYRTAWELEPENLYFLKQEGYCHYRLHAYDRALECLARAFRDDPADFYVKGSLEKIFTRTGRLEDFLALLEEVYGRHSHNVKLLGTIKKIKKQLQGRGEPSPHG